MFIVYVSHCLLYYLERLVINQHHTVIKKHSQYQGKYQLYRGNVARNRKHDHVSHCLLYYLEQRLIINQHSKANNKVDLMIQRLRINK